MSITDRNEPTTYELPTATPDPKATILAAGNAASLPKSLLVGNVIWFCRLRWFVVAIMVGFGLVGMSPGLTAVAGLKPPGNWPFAIAAILVACNVAFLAHARALRDPDRSRHVGANLWCQVVFDLLVLTAVVHFVGSDQTMISFAYLYHIVLACIFLSGARSFIVVLLAVLLYTSCIVAESAGLLAKRSIYAGADFGSFVGLTSSAAAANLASVIGIWLVVWYLGSHLAMLLRKRDEELARTNARLEEALNERARHMLRTTHQLKAPFAAIHAYTQILMEGYVGGLPAEVARIVGRISARSKRLAAEIQEMLQLANLTSMSQHPPEAVELDLAETLRWCIEQARPLAENRRVTIGSDLEPAGTLCVADHARMLLSNVIVNAVMYSMEGGHVRVRCRLEPDGAALVVVTDEGIGILAEKLPRIFEEHYRTNEAVRHNKESSGLGLAIVALVARIHDIRVTVKSLPARGTTFQLRFQPVNEHHMSPFSKENQDGISADRG